MTERKRTVADDVLGKVSRRILDLGRRILEGGVDPDRASFFVAAAQAVPGERLDVSGCTIGDYVLECRWAWDNSHTAFATIALEKSEYKYGFEALLDSSTPKADWDALMKLLRDMCSRQCGGPKPEMVRLYKVLDERYLGINPSVNFSRELKRPVVDLHFVLKPIIWFDGTGSPMPV